MTRSRSPLTLGEEVVLLTLGGSRGRVARALKVGGLPAYRPVVAELQARGLVTREGLRRRPQPSPDAPMTPLRRRLTAILRSVQTPYEADARLLLLVACAGGLDAVSAADHLRARHHIAALGAPHRQPSALLAALYEQFNVESASKLADKLLPGRVRVGPGDLDPGVTSAVWGGGHGGGTLG